MDRGFLLKTSSVWQAPSVVAESLDCSSSVMSFVRPEAEYGVEIGRDFDGRLKVLFRFPLRDRTSGYRSTIEGGEPWTTVPALAAPFAEALYATVRSSTERSRWEAVGQMGRFLQFLSEFLARDGKNAASFSIADLRTKHFEAYIAHLDTAPREDGSPLSDKSKAHFLSPLRKCLTVLRKEPRHKTSLARSEDLSIRMNPWPGRTNREQSKRPIAVADLVNIETACLREIDRWVMRYEEGERLITEGQALKATAPLGDMRLSVVLARLTDDLPDYLSSRSEWRKANPGRQKAILARGGPNAILPYLCATARTLQPFMVLMAIRTAFNPSSIRRMSQNAVKPNPFLPDGAYLDVEGHTESRARVVAPKARARRDQIRTFSVNDPGPANAITLVHTVRRLTARLRPLAEAAYQDRLFLFPAAAKGKPHIRGRVRCLTDNDGMLKTAFEDFVQENGLPDFTMDRIRPTMSEITDLLSGGDIKAQQAILNHRHVDTTDRNYVAEEGRTRRQERLAEILNGRERHIATGGRFDPRGTATQGTHRAVTQGFECYDPYDSPVPEQTPGTLCTAWGDCPVCPLAAVNSADPMALAQLIRLDSAIDEAKERLAPARWLYWGERQMKLRERMALVTDAAVWKAAREIDLKPLSPIE